MTKIVGVRFRHAGRVYYFAPGEFDITPGMNVIVMTARGIEYGTAVSGIREIEDDKVPQGLRPIQRIATEEDTEKAIANREKEREAMAVCKEKIRSHNLEMKLIDAEYTFDNNKILFYFTADGRVDFRELVKDLAGIFRTRIELRQIGVRDETKILGGIGICGRPLCCHSYLTDFIPVSIRMAKEQNLSLNPTKISGVCGRLMCCLKNEEATYQYLNSRLPRYGDYVTTPTGQRGEVSDVNVLRQKVKVVIETDGEKEIHEYDVDDLKIRPRKSRDAQEKTETADNAAPQEKGRGRRDAQHAEEGGRKRGGNRRGEDKRGEDKRGEDKRGEDRRTETRRGEDKRSENTGESRGQQNASNANAQNAQNARVNDGAPGEKKRPRRRHHNRGAHGDHSGAQSSGQQPSVTARTAPAEQKPAESHD